MEYKVLDKRLLKTPLMPQIIGDAGLDLRSCSSETVTIKKGKSVLISSGIAVAIPKNWVGLMLPRSGLGIKFGLVLGNTVGVIDSNYRGEILMSVKNTGDKALNIEPMSRITQLVVVPHYDYSKLELVEELDSTERGGNGFGHSGTT